MKISYLCLVLFLSVPVEYSVQWSGKVCSRTLCRYRTERRCAYRTWSACCSWKYYRVPDYTTVYFCCPGWTTSSPQKCDTPICYPTCENGSTCVNPNLCRCRDGAIGSSCNTLLCNWERPCFPGNCTSSPGRQPICTCDNEFETPSDYCRRLKSGQTPTIFEAQARMSFWQRGTAVPMEKYALYVDSTNSTETDYIWTNRNMFNWLNVTASAQYLISDSIRQPGFIKTYGIGIAKAEAQILLEKTPFQGSNFSSAHTSLDMTIPCTPAVSGSSPTSDTYYCKINKPDFDRSLEHGDNLTVTFKVWSGGFRELQTLDGSRRGAEYFSGHLSEKSVAYRFDVFKPTYNQSTAFYMNEDITKQPIVLRWSDWFDEKSGMFRYSWEVFRLQLDGNLVLKEPDPLGPLSGPNEVMHDSSPSGFEFSYTPPEPGVYSFILEASDRANNSIFIRRIAIYDPSSSVTTETSEDKRLFVSLVNPNGDYKWQQNPAENIEVTWTSHFVNLVHDQGKWLNRILAYPPLLEDFLKNIPQNSNQDDHEGQRTIDEIPNRQGIVKFEIAKAHDSNGGHDQQIPTTGWTNVYLNETFTIDAASWGLSSSGTVTVWVRATDVMGNTRVDSTKFIFDDTPPQADDNPHFQRNIQSNGVPYSSTVQLTVLDMESGLKRVDFTVYKAGTNQMVNNHTMQLPSIPKSACGNRPSCYCPTPLTDCYEKVQTLAISNCMLWVEKELGDSQDVDLQMAFMNMAGLVTRRTIRINNIGELNGTRTYLGPENLQAKDITTTTATVTWTHPASCYNRTGMWISYVEGHKLIVKKLHHSATSYNLAGLKPGTDYIIELISQYGEVKSDPVPLPFVTVSVSGVHIDEAPFIYAALGLVIVILAGLLIFSCTTRRMMCRKDLPQPNTSGGNNAGVPRSQVTPALPVAYTLPRPDNSSEYVDISPSEVTPTVPCSYVNATYAEERANYCGLTRDKEEANTYSVINNPVL